MYRVLLMDRNPYVRSFLSRMLAQRSLKAREVKDGAELLCALDSEERPYVVVYDPEAPGTQGLELLKRLRIKRPEMAVVIHSYQCEDAELAGPEFAVACVEKSADPAPLLAAVERLLRRQASSGGTL